MVLLHAIIYSYIGISIELKQNLSEYGLQAFIRPIIITIK